MNSLICRNAIRLIILDSLGNVQMFHLRRKEEMTVKRTIVSLLLAVLLLTASVGAFAEQVTPSITVADQATPSVTVAQIVAPTGETAVADDFIVALNAIQEETEEKKVFDEIAAFVEAEPVATYFGEEAMTAAAEYLPAELDVSTLVMDEFFLLTAENYDEAYGDVVATFEFVTPYEDETVLLAMVGILPGENAEEDAAITWIPLQAVASEGKVQITFTQEIFDALKENKCVCALLRAE